MLHPCPGYPGLPPEEGQIYLEKQHPFNLLAQSPLQGRYREAAEGHIPAKKKGVLFRHPLLYFICLFYQTVAAAFLRVVS